MALYVVLPRSILLWIFVVSTHCHEYGFWDFPLLTGSCVFNFLVIDQNFVELSTPKIGIYLQNNPIVVRFPDKIVGVLYYSILFSSNGKVIPSY